MEITDDSDNKQKIELFISILISILESKIKFPRTKEQPLLPNQTLMQPNKFKTIFIQFLNHFNVQFDANNVSPTRLNKVYKNDKQRSNKISKLFIDSLYQIKHKMETIENNDKFILFTQDIASKMSLSSNKKNVSSSSSSSSSFGNNGHNGNKSSSNSTSNNNKNYKKRSGRNYHIQTPKDFRNNRRVKLHPRFFIKQQEIEQEEDIDINESIDNMDDDIMSSSINESIDNNKIDSSCSSLSDVSSEYDLNNNQHLQSPNHNIYLPQYENSQNINNINTGLNIQPLYSVMVPLSNNNAIEYQFLSFNPLFVKQNVLSSPSFNYHVQ